MSDEARTRAHRTFVLQRDVDVSGISGIGVVAEGVEFSDGSVVVHWLDRADRIEKGEVGE